MKNRTYWWISMTVLVLVGLSIVLTGSAAGQAADIVVATDGSGDYTSIQNAVSSSVDGDRIEVQSGTYEEDVYITTNVTIIAPNDATIANTSAVSDGTGVSWQSPSAPKLDGFTFTDWDSALSTGGPDARGNWELRNSTIIGGSCAICAPTVEGEWLLENVTIRNADTPVSAYGTTGDWKIRNSRFVESGNIFTSESSGNWVIKNTTVDTPNDKGISVASSSGDWMISETTINDSSSDAIFGESTSGDWTITDVKISNATDNGIEVDDSTGDWTIDGTFVGDSDDGVELENTSGDWMISETTINDSSSDAIFGESTSGDWTITGVTVSNASDMGVEVDDSTGNWTIQNTIVSNIGEDGIEVEDTSGDWTIENSTIQKTGDDTIDASRATGNWKVHQSILQNAAGAGVAADNATEGNASYNYWGSADGPSGEFCGSGAEAYGNITMYPYYTDSSLTTLSSATTSGTVQISTSCVIPEDISESNEQELVLTLSQISADGQSDNITITMPERVSVESVGEPRAIGTPYEVDVTNSGDPIKLNVNPDEPKATVDFVLRVPVELSSSGG